MDHYQLLPNSTEPFKIIIAGTLRNLAANERNRIAIANAGAIPELPVVLLLHECQDISGKIHATSALARLALDLLNIGIIAESGAIEILENLMEHTESLLFRIEAARIFNNLAIGSIDNKIYLAEAGAIYQI